MDGNEVFDDHIDQFQFTDDWSIFLLELFSLLDHELLDIVVGLIGEFKFVVNFGKLLPPMFYLFFER
jgi:hypothetical protein